MRRSPSRRGFGSCPESLLQLEALEDRTAPAVFTVKYFADSGFGTLRQAILAANARPGADIIRIDFTDAINRGLNFPISVGSALPAVTDRVLIDAVTPVVLDGSGVGPGVNGLNLLAAGSIVHGLQIRGFSASGIRIAADNCSVFDCLIRNNDLDGVSIVAGASGNHIGANGNHGNRITGNGRFGVSIAGVGATKNVIQANTIGVDSSGNAAPNLAAGVRIAAGATGNVIGGAVATGNLISGNTGVAGVAISGTTTRGNRVAGNLIGTNADGTGPLANGVGVMILGGARNNTIGGKLSTQANLISGNTLGGVYLTGASTVANVVRGNFVGVNAAATNALPNGGDGVSIDGGARSTVVAGNLISGNAGNGVSIAGAGTNGNRVVGNGIGLDGTGAAILANAQNGVIIMTGARNNTIGGTTAAQGNLISGNAQNGVLIGGTGTKGNVVLGNFIGTDLAGLLDLGNSLSGVAIIAGATGNTVGGTTAGAGNTISGNNGTGVLMGGTGTSGNKVQGNFIGTDKTGNSSVGNSGSGVAVLDGATANVIGGAVVRARNVIAGNVDGVFIDGVGTTGNTVLGNFIGTNVAGTIALPNTSTGVSIGNGASNNTVGGSAVAARNVISGNNSAGVLISSAGTSGNAVLGNFIGTNAAGTADLGNSLDGVVILGGASGNTVGGTIPAARNVISGNDMNGVLVDGLGTTGNAVLGNFIGLNAIGNAALSNGLHGVLIADQASGNTVGSTATGGGNRIAFNGGAGVLIGSDAGNGYSNDAGVGNSVLGNSILGNGGLGIDLGAVDGVTPNDTDDADSGTNSLLNFPVLTTATLVGSSLSLTGSVNTEMGKVLRIEFFASPTADSSGNGEGETFLGFVVVEMGTNTTMTFSQTLTVSGLLPGSVITATATDQLGNTSEFSLGLLVA